MNNIIIFHTHFKKRDDTMKFEELLKELEEKNKKGHNYSSKEIADIANSILNELDYYSRRGATPIVKIAKEFNFETYKETLSDGKSGDIHINGDTKNKYGNDKVILVNKQEDLFHLRFVIAHELAHYLFDFLGKEDYNNLNNITFSEPYQKNQHETDKEKRANAFAAELMMPKDLFIKQYNIAKRESSNRMFVIMYLSRFFETSIDSIEKRIREVSI